jgi:hypothetical protein
MQYDTDSQVSQKSSEVSQKLALDLSMLFAPLLAALDAQLDVRLVRPFLAPIAVIIQFRNRAQGLLLSELGAYLLSPQHAPAGTKRSSNGARARTSGEACSSSVFCGSVLTHGWKSWKSNPAKRCASGMAVSWKKQKARKWNRMDSSRAGWTHPSSHCGGHEVLESQR